MFEYATAVSIWYVYLLQSHTENNLRRVDITGKTTIAIIVSTYSVRWNYVSYETVQSVGFIFVDSLSHIVAYPLILMRFFFKISHCEIVLFFFWYKPSYLYRLIMTWAVLIRVQFLTHISNGPFLFRCRISESRPIKISFISQQWQTERLVIYYTPPTMVSERTKIIYTREWQ